MLALAGPAAAQSPTPDATPATALPAAGAVTVVMAAAATDMGYESLTVSWTVPNTYWTNCTDVSGATVDGVVQAACAGTAATNTAPSTVGDETPLSGFMVYYSEAPFNSVQEAGVMSMASSGGATSRTTGAAKQTLEGLKPNETYYVNVAATNARGTGALAAAPASGMTSTAPLPAAVTGVMVEPGDKMLTVSWDAANPDESVTRTNLLITKYYVQYRKSQTAVALAGDWMPMEPMEVMGDMTTAMIEMLTNDTSYDVQVRAENNAGGKGGWSSQTPRSKGTPTAMTPTPALPLFGAFGLGVGLLAAGRARMRQRRQQALLRSRR